MRMFARFAPAVAMSLAAGARPQNGRGAVVRANGDRYQGQWFDDRAHGQGVNWSASGQVHTGHWENGCFRDGDRWSTAGSSRWECGF
ncbi:MAG: hypothetical protein IPK81_16345 [Rhodospirillales bacterium]|nr:MAG: hypothetical protein IPK81_16345 [Rhodospirillales bacterium]